MIDVFDKNLISQLQTDARISHVRLAKLLWANERTVRNRMKNLFSKGIIKATVVPNLASLGYNFIGIMGLQVRLGDLRKVAEQLSNHPCVCYLANVTGRYEFIAIIVTKTSKEYSEFVETVISAMPSVLKTETFVSLNIYKGHETGLDTRQLVNAIDVEKPRKKAKNTQRSTRVPLLSNEKST